MSELNIENKTTLDKEKLVDRILICVLIIFCIVLTVMGIDIEKKLNILNESEPVIITSEIETVFSTANSLTSTTYEYTSVSAPHETKINDTALVTSATSTTYQETTSQIDSQSTTVAITEAPIITSQAQTEVLTTSEASTTSAAQAHVSTTVNSEKQTYYITASGTKYHVDTCSYLSKTKIEISLDDAINKGYEPCSRCIN